jgi:hypothetical protein
MSGGLEAAILAIHKTGWKLQGLSRSPFDSVRPWQCDLVPGHLGPYYHGTRVKSGLWSTYANAQVRIVADGVTAEEAVRNALAILDKSDAKAVYEDLERAVEDAVDERT